MDEFWQQDHTTITLVLTGVTFFLICLASLMLKLQKDSKSSPSD